MFAEVQRESGSEIACKLVYTAYKATTTTAIKSLMFNVDDSISANAEVSKQL